MKRPLVLFSISLAAGILAAHFSQSVIFVILLAALFLVSVFMLSLKSRTAFHICMGILAFYLLGSALYLYESRCVLERYNKYSNRLVEVRGTICSEPYYKGSRVSYILKTGEIVEKGHTDKVTGKILLNTLDSRLYKYGQRIEVKGELTIPKGQRNPGGFNYREYLAQSGIGATIFAADGSIESIGFDKINPAISAGNLLRGKIVSAINRSLPEEQAGLLNGMLIGYREGLTEDIQEAFSKSGLSHIMAVSGANIAFIVFPLLFVFKKLRLKKSLANTITIAVLIVFVFITGAEPSVLRAAIMAIVLLTAQIMYRENDFYTSIAFAAMILLVSNPFTLFNIGFQLSFAATLSIVLFFNNIHERIKSKFLPETLSSVIAATLAAQLGVLPITLYYFNTLSIISLITNLAVVPLTGIITIIGMLMALLAQVNIIFSQLLGYINLCLLSFVLMVVKLSATLPYSVILIKTPSLWQITAYYCLILFFLWYKPCKKIKLSINWYAGGAVVLLLVILIPLFIPKPLEVVFLDVGQGDSAFIRTSSGKAILIDGGNEASQDSVVSFLLDHGVTRLDLVIATHGHDDHIKGLVPVLEKLGAGTLAIPQTEGKEFDSLLKAAENRNTRLMRLCKGQIVRLDSLTSLEVINPDENNSMGEDYLNNTSLVLKLSYKDISMLFTGDAEADIERQLVESGYSLEADLLKAAHHGSDTSTTQSFLEEVKPAVVVISVGKNNFGHPKASVLDRIDNMGIKLFRTDRDGGIVVKTYGKKLEISKTVN